MKNSKVVYVACTPYISSVSIAFVRRKSLDAEPTSRCYQVCFETARRLVALLVDNIIDEQKQFIISQFGWGVHLKNRFA